MSVSALSATTGTDVAAARGRAQHRVAGWVVVFGAVIGFAASWQLTLDKIRLIADPAFTPACSISTVLNCGSVMQSAQSTAFGFPNSLIGIAAFAMALPLGIALIAGTRLPQMLSWGLMAGSVAGALFVHWLAFHTAVTIGAVCLYCVAVWIATLSILGAASSVRLSLCLARPHRPRTVKILTAVHDWLPVAVVGWIGLLGIGVVTGLVTR